MKINKLVLLLFSLLLLEQVNSSVVLSEIMYHPRQGSDFEYIELHNTDTNAVNIAGWNFTTGIHYLFPAGASIAGNGYIVVANKRASFLSVYKSVPSSIVFGDAGGKLSGKKSETITLVNDAKALVFAASYSDNWHQLADGYGSSIELLCDSAVPDYSDSNIWRASLLPIINDPLLEYSGSPGKAGSWVSCPPPPKGSKKPDIFFSEIMYHPVDENQQVEVHEFIELFNGENTPVDIGNFRIVSSRSGTKAVMYSFPQGTTIPSRSYFLVTKSKAAFTTVYSPSTTILQYTFGDYRGELANGGDKVALVDTNGRHVDEVDYDNKFPWPLGANALGGNDEFLGYPTTPFQYKGLSLERVSFNISSTKTYNWVASTPTPGIANTGARVVPLPCATTLNITQAINGKSIENLRPDTLTTFSVKISPAGTYTNVRLEYYVEDLYNNNEQHTTVTLTASGEYWNYIFTSGFNENAIVRYRIIVDYNAGSANQVISPRSNDPIRYHGMFFGPSGAFDGGSKSYHVFIRTDDWTTLWTNLRTDTPYKIYTDGTDCCVVNPNWNDEVKVVFGYKGKAYDAFARYQGSAYNRFNGPDIDSWSFPAPTSPSPLRALSWKLTLPSWLSIDGKNELVLLKPRDASCSFVTSYVMYDLARQLGMPAPKVSFAKLFVNGGYYLYAMDVEYFSSDQIQDYIDDHTSQLCLNQASEVPGFMFKAQGYGCEGPIGPANEEYLYPVNGCPSSPISTLSRMMQTYNLENHKSFSADSFNDLIGITDRLSGPNEYDFNSTDSSEIATVKAWFRSTFDVNLVLNYITLVNWAGVWDDLNGNHMIYQRMTDDKWLYVTWDMDSFFGRTQPCVIANCSIFLGEAGAPVSENDVAGASNTFKDAFIKTFRTELIERFKLLAKTVLSPANVNASITKAVQAINITDLLDAPGDDYDAGCVNYVRDWQQERYDFVTSTYGTTTTTTLNVCPDKPTITPSITTFTSAPGQPSPPVIKTSETGVRIYWWPPNSNGRAITSYTLQRATSITGTYSTVYSGGDLYYDDASFVVGMVYQVRAENPNPGPFSYNSNYATDGPLPSVTTGTVDPDQSSGNIILISSILLLIIFVFV